MLIKFKKKRRRRRKELSILFSSLCRLCLWSMPQKIKRCRTFCTQPGERAQSPFWWNPKFPANAPNMKRKLAWDQKPLLNLAGLGVSQREGLAFWALVSQRGRMNFTDNESQ
jgi:hypothetical protein